MHHATDSPACRAHSAAWVTLLRWCLTGLLLPGFLACGFGGSRSNEPLLGGFGGTGDGGVPNDSAEATGSGGSTAASGSNTTHSHNGDRGGPSMVCGDGELDASEECDDANALGGDGCDSHCFIEVSETACGDGWVEGSETCDDANLVPGDGCDANCRTEGCGNNRLDVGEECDPPDSSECTSSCLWVSPNCGDRTLQEDEFEECDDGNDEPTDGCHLCRVQCGNGRLDLDLGEECEPRYSADGSCSEACRYLPVCGDGKLDLDAGEECDPDNGVTCSGCLLVDPPDCENGAAGAAADCPQPACVPSSSAAGELVSNGSFDAGFAPWAPHQPLISLTSVSEGVPDPDALQLNFASGPLRAASGAFQCIAIQAGAQYQLEAEYFLPLDAATGVAADVTVLLYPGPACTGPWVPPPGRGPVGRVRDVWTPYQYPIDTSPLVGLTAGEARMLVRLNVIRPADASNSSASWDNVSIADPGSSCGNCIVDPGETCDDGNRTVGDGCGRDCDLEVCGNGVLQPPEQCDDGNSVFGSEGDTCTASCRTPSACDTCARVSCSGALNACAALAGQASDGPVAGSARSTLCDRLRHCIHESACDQVPRNTEGVPGAFLENCYCGSAGTHCFDTGGAANGSCKAEVEAALETTDPIEVFERFGGVDTNYPIAMAIDDLLACEESFCDAECVLEPACGDGFVQDRNLEYTFVVDRQEVACRDDLTYTGRGCSFEECDDHNQTPGDGCDETCFLERCGNYVVQSGEECDDGNVEPGDGCSSDCQAEFHCGDHVVQEPFEECDPASDAGRVCSLLEYEQDPSQCGCDATCQRLVCGDGIAQRPAEACDPPNGVNCGPDCQWTDVSECEGCLNSDPDLADFNQTFCNTDPLCFNITDCIGSSGCFKATEGHAPAECFCGVGSDLAACETVESFQPSGPCADEIRAGAGTNPSNADILNRFYDPNYALGVAGLIFSSAQELQVCIEECRL